MADDPLLDLISALGQAIGTFNLRKAAVLKQAFEHGGDDEVHSILDALDDLRNARSELVQRKLDTNAAGFEKLAKSATEETGKLEKSIDHLEATARIVNAASGILDMIGRLVIRFGL
jgi:hypothetical protein